MHVCLPQINDAHIHFSETVYSMFVCGEHLVRVPLFRRLHTQSMHAVVRSLRWVVCVSMGLFNGLS